MSESTPREPRFKSRNLLGILAFLRRYPGRVSLCLLLLLINIGIDVSLPQFIGDAITDLRRHVDEQTPFSPRLYVEIILSLVLIRAGVAYILGPIRNRTVQFTLADIRAAITTRCSGCRSPITTKPTVGN